MFQALRRSVERTIRSDAVKEEDDNLMSPDMHKVMICKNNMDNTPETFSFGTAPNDSVFCISQSRSPGSKDEGQDAMATATIGDWECNVLCDGHDRDGHLVAREVCTVLPRVVLNMVVTRTEEQAMLPVTEQLFVDAFEECANRIAWTSEGVQTGMFVKVFGDTWDGKVGYVGVTKDRNHSIVIIVDANGYHRPTIHNSLLRRAKYMGGSTCVCLLRNTRTGEARIAQTGDSRVLLMHKDPWEDPIMYPVMGIQNNKKKKADLPMGMTTPAHNVFSKEELLRLNTHHAGAFEIDGAFLVNPVTKFAIQPTRGFGDFDMFGTGYTNEPEVSASFVLEEGSFVLAASDGVFDEHVWKDDELVSFFDQQLVTKKGEPRSTKSITEMLYNETLERSLAGGYVDDISIFCFVAKAPVEEDDSMDLDTTSESASESGLSTRAHRHLSSRSDIFEEAAVLKAEQPPQKSKSKLAAKSLPRKGILGALSWNKTDKKSRKKRAKSLEFNTKNVEIDEDLLNIKPDIDMATPEDRRTTIQRKDRGSFTELSNMLIEVIGENENDDVSDITKKDEGDLASVVLKRYAYRYGHNPDEAELITAEQDEEDLDEEEPKRRSGGKRSSKSKGRKS